MIQAEVRYTRKHFARLAGTVKRKPDWFIIIAAAFFAVNIVLAAADGVQGNPRLKAYICICIPAFVAIIFRAVKIHFILPAKAAKAHNAQCPDPMHFRFTEEAFVTDNGHESRSYPWDELYRAVKLRGYYVIYRSRNRAFMTGSHELTEGTPAELDALLREKLGNRFKEGK